MKPGDKVWIFEGWEQKIKEKTIKTIIYEDGREIIVCKGIPFPYAFGRDAFPTREALCEHYRKIFE